MRLRRSHYTKAWWSEAISLVVLTSDFCLLTSLVQPGHLTGPSRGNLMSVDGDPYACPRTMGDHKPDPFTGPVHNRTYERPILLFSSFPTGLGVLTL